MKKKTSNWIWAIRIFGAICFFVIVVNYFTKKDPLVEFRKRQLDEHQLEAQRINDIIRREVYGDIRENQTPLERHRDNLINGIN